MTKAPAFALTGESVTVIWESKAYTIQAGSPHFHPLREALKNKNWDAVPKFLTVKETIKNWSRDKFKITDNHIEYEDRPLPERLATRILSMLRRGEKADPLFHFWERLHKNPSFRSVAQLWGFLEHENIPLTEDGCFLAYKAVQRNYKDKHSGTVNNRIGVVNKMPRNQISDDPKVACHDGFHVGALGYVNSFRTNDDHVIICKVDPEHVVCVPYDERQQKMRVCEYKVMGHYGSPLSSTTIQGDEYMIDLFDKTKLQETDPVKKPVNKPVKKAEVRVQAKVVQKEFARFKKMTLNDLMAESLDTLRKYATYGLKIIGASKIPGGKLALANRVLEVRGKA